MVGRQCALLRGAPGGMPAQERISLRLDGGALPMVMAYPIDMKTIAQDFLAWPEEKSKNFP
jgi:hypothetical protein